MYLFINKSNRINFLPIMNTNMDKADCQMSINNKVNK